MGKKCSVCGQELSEDNFADGSDTCKACAEAAANSHSQPDDRLARIERLLADATKSDEEREADIQRRIDEAVAKAGKGDPETPSKTEDRIEVGADRWDLMDFSRGDFELARILMAGVGPRLGVAPIEPSEDFMRAYRYHVFEAPPDIKAPVGKRNYGQRIMHSDANGNPTRAMDTAESGYGADLIGAQYVRDMWEAARNMDGLMGRIREIPMNDPTVYVPIDGNLPEMLYVSESTSASATAYTTTKTASSKVTLTAKKFTIQQIWSGELNEDSIVPFVPFLRQQLNRSAALHIGSSYLNGDTTNAGTGNVNLDDANPDDTKHYLAYNGIRYYWITTTSGQGKDMAGPLDPTEIVRARGKLNGADDDVDSLIKNVNWGLNARDLLLICDWDTYMNLLELDVVQTVDKYGDKATVVTGELGAYAGIPIIAPSYCTKTDTDGKAVDTEASNLYGQISVINPDGWLAGVRRETQLFFDRIQRTDQFLIELYTRRAFTKFGENVAAGIYDIHVA